MPRVRLYIEKCLALRAGHDRPYGFVVTDVPAGELSPAQRDTLSRFGEMPYSEPWPSDPRPSWYPGPDADFYLDGESRYATTGARPYRDICHTVVEPTVAEVRRVLDAIAERDAQQAAKAQAEAAEQAAKHEAEIARLLATPPAELVRLADHRYGEWQCDVAHLPDDQRLAELRDQLAAIREQRIAEAQAAEAQAAEAKAAEQAAWIARHGSQRLRKLAAYAIPHQRTYERERAAWEAGEYAAAVSAERPGWAPITLDELATAGYGADRRPAPVADVSERVLALLEAARQVAPQCTLARTRGGKYVVVEIFRGQWIYWPRD